MELDEKIKNLNVYNRISNDISKHRQFYNKITENSINKSKSQEAKDSIAFTAWFLLHRFNGWSDISDLSSAIVDGPDDNQIDAIVTTTDDKLYIIQSKFTQYPIAKDNGIDDVELVWKKITHRKNESFDNVNSQLETKLKTINKYAGGASKQIVLCLVTPTDVSNANKENNEWTALKNRIEKSSTNFSVLLYKYKDLDRLANSKDEIIYNLS